MTTAVSGSPTDGVLSLRGSLVGSAFVEQRLPSPFSPLVLHNDSRLISADPPIVTSDVPLAGYCAAFPRSDACDRSSPEALEVRLHVVQGTIGVGLLDPSGEKFLAVQDGLQGDSEVVTFLIGDLRRIGALVIRNAGSEPVRFEWLGADSYALQSLSAVEFDMDDTLAPIPGWSRYYGGYGATLEERLRQFQYDQLREPFVRPWREGLRVVINPGEETSRALCVSGAYEPASMIALRRLLGPGSVFVDVGANVGLFSLAASRWVGEQGHVYAFEPSSRELQSLHRNLQVNDLRNVTVVPSAVSERSGNAVLHVAGGIHRGQNTLAPTFAYRGVELERVEQVSVVTLDEIWPSRRWRTPDVVKIDAEGMELRVLRGALSLLRSASPALLFEVNETLMRANGTSVAALETLVRRLGYTLHRLDDATAGWVPIASLAGEHSENFLALPAGGRRE